MPSTTVIDFERVLEFLQQPDAYPHHPLRVEIRQTHASVIAIVPPYVYKVKKRVNLGFLDFRSLADRKANCDREVHLNGRLCPELYVAVVPISRQSDDGRLTFGAGGDVVDYALQMNQLPDGFFLKELLVKGLVTPLMLEPVLVLLKYFYEKQTPDSIIAQYGNVAHLKINSDENFNTLRQFAGDTIHPVALQAISQFTEHFYENQRPLLEKRIRENRIKDGHGDLHLEHIHVQDGKVCIYDCIEINDRFRYLDVASDIAFLAMDFDFYQRPNLARYVIDRMAQLLNDPEMKQLMTFYQCYRACVRAKVESLRSSELEVPASERQQSRENAIRYSQFALRYATLGSVPAVILVGGRIGSGKSTLARQLTQLLGAEYLSSDVVRKEQASIPQYERTAPEKRAYLYAATQKDSVYESLLGTALKAVRQGRICLVDATFGQLTNRTMFTAALTSQGIPYYFLETQASELTTRLRLKQREHQPQVVSDARLNDFDRLNRAYQEPAEIPQKQFMAIRTETSLDDGLSDSIAQIRAANQ